MKPFLKYAGGKYSVIEKIMEVMPEGDRLVDVFCGGGSIFMNSSHKSKLVTDINKNLIDMFKAVQSDPGFIILALKEMYEGFRGESGYYDVRDSFNDPDTVGVMTSIKAAQLIYLNHHCFNGVMRFSKRDNKFNVPYGKRKNPYLPIDEIKYFSVMANECTFLCQDYSKTISACGAGDVVVCDPPYQAVEGSKMFTEYSGGSWNMERQEDLTRQMVAAYERGAALMVFNSPAKCIRELYADYGFTLYDLPTRRSVGAAGGSRSVAVDVMGVMVHE